MTESGSPVPPADQPDDAEEAPPGYRTPEPPAVVSRETLGVSPPPASGPGPVFEPDVAPPPGPPPSAFPPPLPAPPPTPGPSPGAGAPPAEPRSGPSGASPWSQPAPAYPQSYPPTTGYPPASQYQSAPLWAATVPTEPVPSGTQKRPRLDWKTYPPSLLCSAAISAGIILLFLANLLVALGEVSGTPGNVRLLQFLSPADVAVAALLVVAVALVVLGPRAEKSSAPAFLGAEDVRLMAGFVAVAVAAAAFVRAIVVLTIAHEHAVLKLGNMVDALAAVLVAAAAAFWAMATK